MGDGKLFSGRVRICSIRGNIILLVFGKGGKDGK